MKALFVFMLTISATLAQAEVDLEAGKARFVECSACHGAQAEGNAALNAPALSHLQPVYIVRQLQNYATGVRSGEPGTPAAIMAASVDGWDSIAEKRNLAVYINSLPSTTKNRTLSGDAEQGATTYRNLCAGCHGRDGEGKNVLHAPALAGAHDWYLLAQMKAFQDRRRGSHQADQLGAQMQSMANLVDDEGLSNIIAYLQTRQRN